jgi:hypothetical protein
VVEWLERLLQRLVEVIRHISNTFSLDFGDQKVFEYLGYAEQAVFHCLKEIKRGFGDNDFGDEKVKEKAKSIAIRSMVGLCDFIDLCSTHLYLKYQFNWGEHLIASSHFSVFAMHRLPIREIKGKARDVLSRGITRFLFYVIVEIRDNLNAPPNNVEIYLDKICRCLGGGWANVALNNINIPLYDLDDAIKNLGGDKEKFKQKEENGEILVVRDWSGLTKYPEFQFCRKEIDSIVKNVLENSDLNSQSWSTVLYLYQVVENSLTIEDVQNDLLGAGRWVQSSAPTSPFREQDKRICLKEETKLFRITGSKHSPFFFSTYLQTGTCGRFDLPRSGEKGSLYMALTIQGACYEVFSRQPNVSLGDLLTRKLWTVTTRQDLNVADLTSEGARAPANTNRRVTQTVAIHLANQSDCKGILAQLRSNASERGVTLFGPKGATPPAIAGFGIWQVSSCQLLDSEEILEFLDNELGEPTRFPVIHLSRFPSDLTFSD